MLGHGVSGRFSIPRSQCVQDRLMVSKSRFTLGKLALALEYCRIPSHLTNDIGEKPVAACCRDTIVEGIIEGPDKRR